VRTIKLKVGLHSKQNRPKKLNFLSFLFLGASTLPPQNTDTNMKKKSSEFFLYETETICDAAPHFCLFFSTHDIETKRLIDKKKD